MRRNLSGFGLVELTVVVAIIVALAAVVIPTVGSQRRGGRVNEIMEMVDVLRLACQRFHVDTAATPREFSNSTSSSNHQLSIKQPSSTAWAGPYIPRPLSSGGNGFVGDVLVHDSLDAATGGGFKLTSASGPKIRGPGSFVRFTKVPHDVARLCDETLDDGVPGRWTAGGRVCWTSDGGGTMDVFLLAVDGR